jgi:hypothetical protein
MRRLRAILLAVALVASPLGVLASNFAGTPACCASGEMCPLHKNHTPQQHSKQSPCDTHGDRQPNLACTMHTSHQHADAGIPQFTPDALFSFYSLRIVPQVTAMAVFTELLFFPIRSSSPPDQPPRL